MDNKNLKKYHITTFGCQMNVSDSERVSAVSENLGYVQTDDIKEAQLIIINSCSIRQKAEDRVIGMGKKILEIKSLNPNVVTILTGCMAKREDRAASIQELDVSKNLENDIDYEIQLKKWMPWLDFVIQIKDIHKLGRYLGVNEQVNIDEYLSIKPKTNRSFFQYIPISTGCNKFCTFCIVPFSRGKEIYRPFYEIINEVKSALNSGAKDITLLGQNVNSWRGSKYSKDYIESKDPHRLLKNAIDSNTLDFSDLLHEIGTICDIWELENKSKVWVRFTSSHPYDIDEKLVDVIKDHSSLANQFHFAMQSGSNSVLKRMNRHYTIDDFKMKCNLIRESIPDVGISTDIIVGFCGETDSEHEDTKKVLEELRFDQAFISEYSNRKGTVASKLYKDTITNEVKSKRKEELNNIVGKGNELRNREMINKIYSILIYKKNKKGLIGRTENSKDVILNTSTNIKMGQFVNVKITDCTQWSLFGEVQI